MAALGSAGAVGAKPLVHAIPADIASLDPADIRGQQDQEIGTNIYERLVKMKFNARPDGTLMADPVEVVPELAEILDGRRPGHHLQAAAGREVLSRPATR